MRLTSGLSYILRSSSRQTGVSVAQLPHTVIRPPGLIEISGPEVDAIMACLTKQVCIGRNVNFIYIQSSLEGIDTGS